MTSSEKLTTQSETFEGNTTVTIRRRVSDHLDTTVMLMFKELVSKTVQFEEDDMNELSFSTDRNLLLMQFCKKGSCEIVDDRTKALIGFNAGECNVLYVPQGDFKVLSFAKETVLLNVFIDEHFFFRQLPKNHFAFGMQKEMVLAMIFAENMIIKPHLKAIIKEIRNCEFDAPLKKLYLKAKVIELLTLQLVQYEQSKVVALKPLQIEKMAKVRALIDQDLSESPSLAQLARVAGTNEQYLKKHFKLIYGHTVFGYILLSKMEKAKELLLTGEESITAVAEAVGYKHATHFTNAFKKFFGHLPKLVKGKLLLGSYFSLGIEFEFLELLMAV